MEQRSQRIGKLDSVRGIAALMVVIGHCGGLSFFGLAEVSSFRWLHILWDGESAVIMFFLLSGYVLALQLGSTTPPAYPQYLIRRFMRIWPAFAVTVLLAWGVFVWHEIPVDAGQQHGPPKVPDWHDLVSNLFMYGNAYAIDPPVWSLFVEMRLSIVFPWLFLLARGAGAFWAVLISMIFSVGFSRAVHWPLPDFLLSLAEASRYMVLFVTGAVLAQAGNPVERGWGKIGAMEKLALLALALACLLYRFLLVNGQGLPWAGYVRWCGVALLFVFCLYSPTADKILGRSMFLFLGRVSYGVYLAHFPILVCAKKVLSGSEMTFFVVLSSILVGWAINVWVEQPMVCLGRRITAILKGPDIAQS